MVPLQSFETSRAARKGRQLVGPWHLCKPSLVAHWQKFARSAGDRGLNPGSGTSPGGGNGNPFQHSCLENPMDGGASGATVHGVAKGWARLSE